MMLRLPQMKEDEGDLQGIELLDVLMIPRLLQLLQQRGATVDPSHQMSTCHIGSGVWEIEET